MLSNYIDQLFLTTTFITLFSFLGVFIIASYTLRFSTAAKKRRHKDITEKSQMWITKVLEEKQADVYYQAEYWVSTILKERNFFARDLLPRYFKEIEIMLPVLENFDMSIKDAQWEKLKAIILHKRLLPKARRFASSYSRKKRHLACRCFSLGTEKIDENKILKLLKDPFPSVRIEAAISAVQSKNTDLIQRVFCNLLEEDPSWSFAYKDALIKGGSLVVSWLQNQLSKEKNVKLRALYLEILSLLIQEKTLAYLENDLKSLDKGLRLCCTKILSQFSTQNEIEALKTLREDADEQIRLFAIGALSSVMKIGALEILEQSIHDSSWNIRLQSALELKKLGKEGRTILEKQKKNKNSIASEACQFVLALPAGMNYGSF